jgi:hypothetical protein
MFRKLKRSPLFLLANDPLEGLDFLIKPRMIIMAFIKLCDMGKGMALSTKELVLV